MEETGCPHPSSSCQWLCCIPLHDWNYKAKLTLSSHPVQNMPRLCIPAFQIKLNLQYSDAITVCPGLTSIWTKHQVSAGLSEPPALKEQKVWLQESDSWKLWCFCKDDVCVLHPPSSFSPFNVFTQCFKENDNIHMINTPFSQLLLISLSVICNSNVFFFFGSVKVGGCSESWRSICFSQKLRYVLFKHFLSCFS